MRALPIIIMETSLTVTTAPMTGTTAGPTDGRAKRCQERHGSGQPVGDDDDHGRVVAEAEVAAAHFDVLTNAAPLRSSDARHGTMASDLL